MAAVFNHSKRHLRFRHRTSRLDRGVRFWSTQSPIFTISQPSHHRPHNLPEPHPLVLLFGGRCASSRLANPKRSTRAHSILSAAYLQQDLRTNSIGRSINQHLQDLSGYRPHSSLMDEDASLPSGLLPPDNEGGSSRGNGNGGAHTTGTNPLINPSVDAYVAGLTSYLQDIAPRARYASFPPI